MPNDYSDWWLYKIKILIFYGLPGKIKMKAAANPPNGCITLPMSGMKMAKSIERKHQMVASIRCLVNCHRSKVSSFTLVNLNNPATNKLSRADLSKAKFTVIITYYSHISNMRFTHHCLSQKLYTKTTQLIIFNTECIDTREICPFWDILGSAQLYYKKHPAHH